MGAVMRLGDRTENAFAAAVVRGAAALCAALLAFAPGTAGAPNGFEPSANGARWVQLDRGGFALGQFDGRFGDRSQRPIVLPHAWETTDPGVKGDGWYTFEWKLERVPMAPQGLCLTALTVPTEVYVNGDRVTATGPLDGRRPYSYEQSRFVEIPVDSLREGVNYVSLHLRALTPDVAGLGVVLAGDAEPLRERAHRVLFVHTLAPAAISVATFTVGVFIAALWLRRRDPGYALFAAAVILWSVHTLLTLLPEAPLPQPHWAILWTWMYLVFVAMLCLFCVRFAGVRWRSYERLVQAYGALTLPALYLSY